MKYFLPVFSIFLTLSIKSHATQLYCNIFDLPSGENFIESSVLDVTDQQFNEGYLVDLKFYLISAKFIFEKQTSGQIKLSIQTQEVWESESGEFFFDLNTLPKNQFTRVGYVSTELTGIGNNTFSQCFVKP